MIFLCNSLQYVILYTIHAFSPHQNCLPIHVSFNWFLSNGQNLVFFFNTIVTLWFLCRWSVSQICKYHRHTYWSVQLFENQTWCILHTYMNSEYVLYALCFYYYRGAGVMYNHFYSFFTLHTVFRTTTIILIIIIIIKNVWITDEFFLLREATHTFCWWTWISFIIQRLLYLLFSNFSEFSKIKFQKCVTKIINKTSMIFTFSLSTVYLLTIIIK